MAPDLAGAGLVLLRVTLFLPAAALALVGVALLLAAFWRSQAEARAAGLHPPAANVLPHAVTLHGDTRVDEYAWLRDRDDPAVLRHLEAENAYTEAVLRELAPLRERLYAEMLGRIQETDADAPYPEGTHWYYARTEEGKQYPLFCRRPGTPAGAEEILLDENELSRGHGFFALGTMRVSPDERLLAYTADTNGSETYDLYVKDLRAGANLPDRIHDVESVAWGSDSAFVCYTTRDASRRACRLWRHRLGSDPAGDELLYEETDARYALAIGRSKSGAFIVIQSFAGTSDEIRCLRADLADAAPVVVLPREDGVEYALGHHGDAFYILTNRGARNFRLVKAPLDDASPARWTEVVPHREEVTLEGMELFRDHLVLFERADGLPRIAVRDLRSGAEHRIAFPEPVYAAFNGVNRVWGTATFRFTYQSFTTPPTVYDYDLDRRERTLVKRTPVRGEYRAEEYVSERIAARAPDGAMVPVSLVYRRSARDAGPAPLFLTGYGAYGISWPVTFSSHRLSLLDRGVIIGIAHVRGGGDLGRDWKEGGRMLRKETTFSDFIACAEHLVAAGYTASDRLVIEGASAGGLLVGAVMNRRPDLFRAVLARVPFVDVLNTMLDPSLPLTTGEYLEWGDPNEKVYYDAIKAYCPYTNVRRQAYPALLATVGLNDPRVSYWEGAKWVARLRALRTDDGVTLLKVNMGAGHQGASGRYDRLKEIAFEYAYILSQVGKND